MTFVFTLSRLLLGVVFVVFGLNGFVSFIPVPEQPEAAALFIQQLIDTGYMLYFWKSIEVLSGLMLLANRFTLLASLAALPVSANIFAFHLFLDPGNILIGATVLILNLFVLARHKESLKVLMQP